MLSFNSIPQTPLGPSRIAIPAARSSFRVDRTKRGLPFLGRFRQWTESGFTWSRIVNVCNLILRYRDPLTGRHVRKSSGTANTKDARKAAARWEDELNSGKTRGRYAVTWEQFRLRYEQEVLPGLAPNTGEKAGVVFDFLESVLPQVKNGLLRELTSERVSILQAELRKRGRAEATIGSYLAHLRAALAWAVDQGILAELPKMKRPNAPSEAVGPIQ